MPHSRRVRVIGHLYNALLWDELIAIERSNVERDSKGTTQFYLPTTHEPYLPLLPSRRASPLFGWYSLRLPTEEWPGSIDLVDWLYTEIDFPHLELNPGPNTHHSRPSNRARRRITSLIETNTLPLSQTPVKIKLRYKTEKHIRQQKGHETDKNAT